MADVPNEPVQPADDGGMGFNFAEAARGFAIGFGGGLAGKDLVTPWLQHKRETGKASRIRQGLRSTALMLAQTAPSGVLKDLSTGNEGGVDITPDVFADMVADMDPAQASEVFQEMRERRRVKAAETKDQAEIDRVASGNITQLTTMMEAEGAPKRDRADGESLDQYASYLEGAHLAYGMSTAKSAQDRDLLLGGIKGGLESANNLPASSLLGSGTKGIEEALAEADAKAEGLFPSDRSSVKTAVLNAKRALFGAVEAAKVGELKSLFSQGIFDQRTTTADGLTVALTEENAYAAGLGGYMASLDETRAALSAATAAGVTLDGEAENARLRLADLDDQPLGAIPEKDRYSLMNSLYKLGGPAAIKQKFGIALVERSKSDVQTMMTAALSNNQIAIPEQVLTGFLNVPGNFATDQDGRWTAINDNGAINLSYFVDGKYLRGAAQSEALANRIISQGAFTESAATKFRQQLVTRGAQNGPVITSWTASNNEVVIRSTTEVTITPEQSAAKLKSVADLQGADNEFDDIWKTFAPLVYPGKYEDRVVGAGGMEPMYIRATPPSPPTSKAGRRAFLDKVIAGGDELLSKALAQKGSRSDEATAGRIKHYHDLVRKGSDAIAVSGSTINAKSIKDEVRGQVIVTLHDEDLAALSAVYASQITDLQAAANAGTIDKSLLEGRGAEIAAKQQALEQERQAGFGAGFRESVIKDILLAWSFEKDWSDEKATERIAGFTGGSGIEVGKMLRGQAKVMADMKEAETPSQRFNILVGWLQLNPDALLTGGPMPGGQQGEIRYGMLMKDISKLLEAAGTYGENATKETMAKLGWSEGMDETWNDHNRGLWLIYKALQR